MSVEILTLLVNAIATPVLVIFTMWIKNSFSRQDRQQKREDGFIANMEKRIVDLERDIREVRVELKNRDAEYIELYKQYTTLKAKYEVLNADYQTLHIDHEDLKMKYGQTVKELAQLGTNINI